MIKYPPEGNLYNTEENRALLSSPAGLTEAAAKGTILEARAVLCDSEHNLHIDLGCMRGIMPRNECAIGMEEGTTRDIAVISRVNRPVMFRVLEVEDTAGKPFAVLSRRLAQEEALKNYIDRLRPGDVISAKVTHLEPFGAFCDIGAGLSALMPIDCISVSRIPHPSARLRAGQCVRALVKGRDALGRLTLTMKELLGTWEQNAALFEPGQTVPGIVRSVEKYGVFIELTPNLAGLSEYVAGVLPGEHTGVFIKSINPSRMKIKLIIVDNFTADYPLTGLRYFFTGEHMDTFLYSPACCDRKLVTVFE